MINNRGVEISDVSNVGGGAPSIDMSIMGLFNQSDIVVKTVMIMLLFASFWCWSIVITKYFSFKIMKRSNAKFDRVYSNSDDVEKLYDSMQKTKLKSAMAAMFVTAMQKANLSSSLARLDAELLSQYKEKIYISIDKVKNEYLSKMEDKLIVLATVGSAAPFIGLFGTVWGIVNSFKAIAEAKNTSLAVVAPGIAEALLATAIGLFAAIPAVIFYNLFSNQIRRVAGQLDDFSNQLSSDLAYREI